jgi:hypothetical protein
MRGESKLKKGMLHDLFKTARSVQNCTLSGMELEKVVAGAPIGTQRRVEA